MDEVIAKLCDDMKMAASDDVEANANKAPAAAKLKMMPRVMSVLEKYYFEFLKSVDCQSIFA